FESFGLRSLSDPAGLQRIQDFRLLLFPNERRGERQERGPATCRAIAFRRVGHCSTWRRRSPLLLPPSTHGRSRVHRRRSTSPLNTRASARSFDSSRNSHADRAI